VTAVETVDDVETILEWIERLNWLGQRRIGEGTVITNAGSRKASLGIKSLILHEENHPFKAAGASQTGSRGSSVSDVRNNRGAKCGTEAGSHSLEQVSSVNHELCKLIVELSLKIYTKTLK
jgi:hypothetical protein